jgi:hypothetical protein
MAHFDLDWVVFWELGLLAGWLAFGNGWLTIRKGWRRLLNKVRDKLRAWAYIVLDIRSPSLVAVYGQGLTQRQLVKKMKEAQKKAKA